MALVEVTFVIVVLLKLVVPVILKFVPVAFPKLKFAIVPTAVKLGKEVDAEIAKKVLVARAG